MYVFFVIVVNMYLCVSYKSEHGSRVIVWWELVRVGGLVVVVGVKPHYVFYASAIEGKYNSVI